MHDVNVTRTNTCSYNANTHSHVLFGCYPINYVYSLKCVAVHEQWGACWDWTGAAEPAFLKPVWRNTRQKQREAVSSSEFHATLPFNSLGSDCQYFLNKSLILTYIYFLFWVKIDYHVNTDTSKCICLSNHLSNNIPPNIVPASLTECTETVSYWTMFAKSKENIAILYTVHFTLVSKYASKRTEQNKVSSGTLSDILVESLYKLNFICFIGSVSLRYMTSSISKNLHKVLFKLFSY